MSKTGGVDVLEYRDVPVPPVPGAGQLLVRNRFAGVNYIDTYFRNGLYPAPVLPLTLGREAAGEVVAAADDASSSFPPGTRVVYLAETDAGSYAEYTVVSAAKTVAVPDGLGLDKAAAVLLQGLTAWTFICEAGSVRPDQWTLVHAAAGGVGLLLVQMLRIVGAKVIGTASSGEKRELVRKNGAGWVLDSRNDDIVARVKEITDGHGIDVLFDGVGKDTFDAGLEMIAMKGRFISFGNAVSHRRRAPFLQSAISAHTPTQSGAVPPVNLLRLGAKNVQLMRPVLYGYVSERKDFEKYTSELFDFVTSNELNVAIHDVYPLKDVARAHTDIESRKTSGKLLIKCD